MKQTIGIPMAVHLAPFWANLFLYSYEEEYMTSLISSDKVNARHFHSTQRFIDDLCSINDGGEFGGSICDIYPKELTFKVEHQGNHATLLNLGITVKEGTFIYKLFNKRVSFPFSIIGMLQLKSNISQKIFYSAIKGEF